MRKISLVLMCLLIIMISLTLTSCTGYEFEQCGIFDIGYNKVQDKAYIAGIDWKIGDSTKIVIPSVYKDIKITELGGYYGRGVPTPFSIMFDIEELYPKDKYPNVNYYASEQDYFDTYKEYNDVNLTKYTLYITLPVYLENLQYFDGTIYYYAELEGESSTRVEVITFEYYFTITKENNYFYTEDGKLYYKDGTLVDEFNYAESIEANI